MSPVIPSPTAVTRTLKMAGLVEAKRAAAGGHALARSPADLTVLNVINAVESGRRVVTATDAIQLVFAG